MTTDLLDISNKIDTDSVALYRLIAEVADRFSVDYLVVGAHARDLVLHYGYGVVVQRATYDLDIGIEVGKWSDYEALRSALIEKGFEVGREVQRLISPTGRPVDLIPFGAIADDAGRIAWLSEHDNEMSVLGFSEARAHAEVVRIAHAPALDIPVVSLPGLILLKIIAWGDRPRDRRAKDAQDVRYVFDSYLKIPHEKTGIWNEDALLERFDHDIDLVVAAVLGRDTRFIASDPAAEVIEALLTGDCREAFTVDMDTGYRRSPSDSSRLVEAFFLGFRAGR